MSEISLHRDIAGSGPPLVLLHGFGASSYAWREVAPALSRRFRVHLLDLKGHGKSPKPKDKRYTVRDHAALVADYIRGLGAGSVILCGHSMGGGIALATALELRDDPAVKIEKLILLDCTGYPHSVIRLAYLVAIPWLGYTLSALISDRLLARITLMLAFYDRRLITPEVVRNYAAPLSDPGAVHALIHSARDLAFGAYEGLADRYHLIECPTLILWGKHDRFVSRSIRERLAAALPNPIVPDPIADCGHNPHEEKSRECLDHLYRFLGLTSPPMSAQ